MSLAIPPRRLAILSLLSLAALGCGAAESGRYANESLGRAGPAAEGGPPTEARGSLSLAWELLFGRSGRAPAGELPELRPDLEAFAAPGGPARFVWFGHSTILLGLDGKAILIDPVFSKAASPIGVLNRRFQPPVLGLRELPRVDAVLISHDHYDHLDRKTIRFLAESGADFVAPAGSGGLLRKWGVPPERVFELGWREEVALRGITYTAAPARHFSGRGLKDRNRRLWASWIVSGSRERVFYSGDSGYGPHFAEIGRRLGPFDLALLECGQYDERWAGMHMTPEQTVQAAADLGSPIFAPVHWGMFAEALHAWSDPIRRASAEAAARGQAMLAPRLGELAFARPAPPPEPWWEAVASRP